MKLLLTKNNLKDALLAAGRAVGNNPNLPILKNVLIHTNEGAIQLTATNLEIAITYSASGKIIEEGKTTTPLGVFLDIVNNLQSERLNLEDKKLTLEIKTDNYEANVQGLPPEEFPLIPKIKDKNKFLEIRGDILYESLAQVVFCAQEHNLRPELNCVLFLSSPDSLKFVATDSFRLGEKTLHLPSIASTPSHEFKLLVPLKTIKELLGILPHNGEVRIYHDLNQILFASDQFELISRLNEGAFPDYQNIIPTNPKTEAVVDREELMNALRLTGVMSGRTHEVKLKIPPHKKALEVSSKDQVIGENTYIIPTKASGEPCETAFNWRYLLDGLKAIKTEKVYVGINEENKPTLLKSPTEPSYFYVLMPILRV